MHRNLLYVSLACLLIPWCHANGQQRPPAIQSPVVNPDRTVTFQLRAPNAEKVELNSQFVKGNQPMTKDSNGTWSITLGPVEPNLYPYAFVVDGMSVADPSNQEIFPNERFKNSLVDIPGNTTVPYACLDVPHGKVAHCWYHSKTLDAHRPLLVYTPPGYEDSRDSLPVLILVSGTTDTEETWFKVGRVHFILDNLIAAKKAKPMIVVMPYGNMMMGAPGPSTPEVADMYRKFADEVVDDILPFVEGNYRVQKDRQSRAIAGFSRGGGQSLFTAFSHLDRFAWVCSYSAYLTPEVFRTHFGNLLESPESTNERLSLLWLGVGKEDFLYQPAVDFDTFLREARISHESIETDGGHTWMNARHYLAETLPKLFQTTPSVAALATPPQVVIENGGTGPLPAVATEDTGLPGMTIIRPRDLSRVESTKKLPVLLWGNGACANSAEEHKNFLNEIASHGYLILAIGPLSQLQEQTAVGRERTNAKQLTEALDWIAEEAKQEGSIYFNKVDTGKVAAMGMSCGGLQAIAISEDPRVTTTVVCNSGILPTPSPMPAMPALTKDALRKFHGPVIYIMGGPSDIAYKNAMDDFSRIDHVPIVMTNLDVGHGGTYRLPKGGEFTRVALAWLKWQLGQDQSVSKFFLGEEAELKREGKWSVEAKNFK